MLLEFPAWSAGKAQPTAAFGMDSNTGRLLPQPGSAAKSGSQDSLGGGSDLLETPPLCTAPSQTWHAPGPSRLRAVATQPSSAVTGNQVCFATGCVMVFWNCSTPKQPARVLESVH